jgi:hypothetical protein
VEYIAVVALGGWYIEVMVDLVWIQDVAGRYSRVDHPNHSVDRGLGNKIRMCKTSLERTSAGRVNVS